MSNVLHMAGKHSFKKKLCVVVILLLLGAFSAKVCLATLCGNLMCAKANKVLIDQNGDQENGDEKEEGKFAAKQLSEYLSPAFLQVAPVFRKVRTLLHHTYLSQFVRAHSLTVLTPPPNC